MMNTQRKEPLYIAALQASQWAKQRLEIKNDGNKFTEEEIHLYECKALTSWESR